MEVTLKSLIRYYRVEHGCSKVEAINRASNILINKTLVKLRKDLDKIRIDN